MDGTGAVTTNSPSWSCTGRPARSKTGAATPSQRQEIPRRHTSSSGLPTKKAVHTSVPPQIGSIRTHGPSCS